MESIWKVKVWGARGSMPVASAEFLGYGGNTACISLDRGEGQIIVFDAGSGLTQLGDSLVSGAKKSIWTGRKKQAHILLSHLHMDHIIGLFSFKPFYEEDAQIHIYGQGSGGKLKEQLERVFGLPYWPLGLADMRADIQIHEIGPGACFYLAGEEGKGEEKERAGEGAGKEAGEENGEAGGMKKGMEPVRIRTFKGNHPGQSLLYRLEQGDKSIVHALDCELDRETEEGLAGFARGCDLLLWDGTFTKEELERRKGWGHSCWEQGIGVRRAAGAAKIWVTHHSPNYTDTFLQEQEDLAKAADPACCFAREGMELWI